MKYSQPKIIAEIGCNHKGDFSIAKELIKVAKQSNADVAKFQKRNNRVLLGEEGYNKPHPNPSNSYGETYGEHREFLEFSIEQHAELKSYCEGIGIEYSTSVWDIISAREVISLNPSFIKIPSASNTNFELLKILRDEYNGDIHISTGMTTHSEEEDFISFFEQKNQNHRLVIYSCTSGYPVPFSDICLLEINRLRKSYINRVKSFGFSGHHLGISVDVAAYTIGAEWIERHFTLDRTWKGTDHSASLEPTGLSKLCRDLKSAVYPSLTEKSQEVLPIESIQREKLKFTK